MCLTFGEWFTKQARAYRGVQDPLATNSKGFAETNYLSNKVITKLERKK